MAITKRKTASLKDNSRINAVLMPTKADLFSDSYFEAWPTNEHWRKRLCNEMIEFGEDPKSLYLLDFCSKKNIPRQRLYTLRDKYPDIAQAFENMMNNIGCNRCKMVSMTFVMQHDQYLYDSEWAAGEVRKAELNKKADNNQPTTIVITGDKLPKPEVLPKE